MRLSVCLLQHPCLLDFTQAILLPRTRKACLCSADPDPTEDARDGSRSRFQLGLSPYEHHQKRTVLHTRAPKRIRCLCSQCLSDLLGQFRHRWHLRCIGVASCRSGFKDYSGDSVVFRPRDQCRHLPPPRSYFLTCPVEGYLSSTGTHVLHASDVPASKLTSRCRALTQKRRMMRSRPQRPWFCPHVRIVCDC